MNTEIREKSISLAAVLLVYCILYFAGLPGIALYSIEWVWTVFIQFEIGVFQWNEDIGSDFYLRGAPAFYRNPFDDAATCNLGFSFHFQLTQSLEMKSLFLMSLSLIVSFLRTSVILFSSVPPTITPLVTLKPPPTHLPLMPTNGNIINANTTNNN